MRIGVPREIKVHEYRVGLVPAGVRELVAAGHEVLVESGAGNGIGVDDAQFRAAGAAIAARASEVFERADMVVKVKEPQPVECEMLRQGQVLFTYLHLAADPVQARGLMKSGATAIAYETVTAPNGSLPLLTPMSEVAGRMSIQVGAASLQKAKSGKVTPLMIGGLDKWPWVHAFALLAERVRVGINSFLHAAAIWARGERRVHQVSDDVFCSNLVDMFLGAVAAKT